MKLTGKKFLLIVLYSPIEGQKPNVPISGRTRLMKMGFLFKNEVLAEFQADKTFADVKFPEFRPWKYGPFSKDLLNDLEFLVNQGYIESGAGMRTPIPAELAEYERWLDDYGEFQLSEYAEEVFNLSATRGVPKASELWISLSDNQRRLITEFKGVLNRASLDRILEYVYKKYPEQTSKSKIRGRYN